MRKSKHFRNISAFLVHGAGSASDASRLSAINLIRVEHFVTQPGSGRGLLQFKPEILEPSVLQYFSFCFEFCRKKVHRGQCGSDSSKLIFIWNFNFHLQFSFYFQLFVFKSTLFEFHLSCSSIDDVTSRCIPKRTINFAINFSISLFSPRAVQHRLLALFTFFVCKFLVKLYF